MKFLPTDEQGQLAEAIDDIVTAAGGTTVARSWGAGDHAPGLALWAQLADTGVTGIRVAEDEGGVGGSTTDLAIVFERLGYHAVPGPYVESLALLPALVTPELRADIASGEAMATARVAGLVPLALDADVATHSMMVDETSIVAAARTGERVASIDPARRLFALTPTGIPTRLDSALVRRSIDEATLASAAFLVGAGERMLVDAVAYAKVREQFGKPIGEYQAIKHALASVRVAVTFARPLVHGAAVSLDSPISSSSEGERSVSAAKISAGDAALKAALVALQVHGAIGYTEEYDLSLWLLRVRALVGNWGSASSHRARIAASLLSTSSAS